MKWLRIQWEGCREIGAAVVNAYFFRPHLFHHDGWPERWHLWRKAR